MRRVEPETWGEALSGTMPLSEFSALKAEVYSLVAGLNRVSPAALRVQHFPGRAPFVRRALEELLVEGRLVSLPNGCLITASGAQRLERLAS